MLVAQISDPHILRAGECFQAPVAAPPPSQERVRVEIDTGACLARAVAALNALDPQPDIAVVTGDLCDHGTAEEYAHLRELLTRLAMPFFLIPGNHDTREGMRAAFPDHGYLGRDGVIQYAIEDYPLRLVAVDTLIPDAPGGRLDAGQLAWLDGTLAVAPDRPTLVIMHHPPFATGITYMDGYSLEDPAAFAAVIARHPQVERIACGHLHRPIEARFAGTVAGTAPGTAHQIRLDLRPGEPLRFRFEPPGYQLHLWQEGSGLVTHTAVLGHFPDPYPLVAA